MGPLRDGVTKVSTGSSLMCDVAPITGSAGTSTPSGTEKSANGLKGSLADGGSAPNCGGRIRTNLAPLRASWPKFFATRSENRFAASPSSRDITSSCPAGISRLRLLLLDDSGGDGDALLPASWETEEDFRFLALKRRSLRRT
mmetsp:Transcript_48639/g.56134  ORF Transcript_48639/g.56134 Transcript_48639/m.56134 type:complete len:143 (-) Transcript_48639:8-436(-)